MIPAISPEVRGQLTPEATDEIHHTLENGAVCTVCEAPIRPELERRPSVLGLQEPDGRLLIRFAHERCADSRRIILDGPLSSPRPPASTPEHRPMLAWALAARRQALPTVILACDVDHLTDLDVPGRPLLEALRLDGLRGGDDISKLRPALHSSIMVSRAHSTLSVECGYGRQHLAIAEGGPVRPLLHVAARQRELLLVVGQRLQLGGADLGETERQLRFGDALAARVDYVDPDLAGVPLRRRRLRAAGVRILALAPSARAAARARR
jgi:hypothetical protein